MLDVGQFIHINYPSPLFNVPPGYILSLVCSDTPLGRDLFSKLLYTPHRPSHHPQTFLGPSQAFSPPSDISRALTGVLCPSRHFLPLRDISCPSQALFASHRHFSPLTGISRPSQAFFDLHRHFSPTTGIYRPLQHFRPSQTLLCHPGNLSKTKPQCQYCIGWDA